MIAVTFALETESRDFERCLRRAPGPRGLPAIRTASGWREIVVFYTGMGFERTRERLPRLFESHCVEWVMSAGYAGGLDPALPAGALVLAENGSDPKLLASARSILKERACTGLLATSTQMQETREAKARLAKATGAIAVDMETEAIARECRDRGVPLLSLRVISDAAGEELPVPFSVCFDAVQERPRIGALLLFLACRPWRVRRFVKFARTAGRARKRLAAALLEVAEMMNVEC